ncbi:MAG TPA: protein translocase subunit SecF [Syntrophomonadaceae bacterium]|nr:protein translocase subunit SecF [Syntrophomonadaceae bacterium]
MVNLIRIRKYWYIFSLLIIIPGMVSLYKWGLNYGIDFTGGSLVEVRFDQAVKIEDIRNLLGDLGLGKDSQIQTSGGNTVLIRTRDLSQEESDKLLNGLSQKIGSMKLLRNEKVGPTIGKELRQKAILSVLIAFALMLVYIAIRFEFLQGVAAILALVHDILVTVGLVSIFRIEVDSAFIAALLTIVGYSIHDTIVIFDRIRENLRMRKKDQPLDELIHHSIMQTLTRSINTVLTVVFCLVALIVIGGVTIRPFMITLLIGVISGAYSSIFNASPLWYDFRRLKEVSAR